MQRYVVGFLFDRECHVCWLVEKNRPHWQKGKLNGVGGHIESGETPLQAMEREFEEEAGIYVAGWEHFLTLTSDEAEIFFYRCTVECDEWQEAYAKTDEKLFEIHPANLYDEPCVPNLYWILPLAASEGGYELPIVINFKEYS